MAWFDFLNPLNAITGLVTLSGGQIAFPATAIPSADPNTLDEYEEGSYTPVLTFTTPGNLAVTYGTQLGRYQRVGNTITVHFTVITTSFTHTTASGSLQINLPFASSAGSNIYISTLQWQGITKASYTSVYGQLASASSTLFFRASGSGQATSAIAVADVPTGGTVQLVGTITYEV